MDNPFLKTSENMIGRSVKYYQGFKNRLIKILIHFGGTDIIILIENVKIFHLGPVQINPG